MGSNFEVRGSADLAALSRRLKEAGEGGLRRQLLAGVRGSAKRAVPSVRVSAKALLPEEGGLGERVAEQPFVVRATYAGSGAKARILGQGMRELKDIDAGRVRKPLFADRSHWYQQAVRPGFFRIPLLARQPFFRRDVQQVMQDVARQITRRF